MSVNYALIVVFTGNLLALIGDTAMTWPSPMIPKLNSTDSPLGRIATKDELSWIASVSGFGSLVGTLPFSFLPDIIGRKPCILLIAIPHMLSFAIAAFAKNIFLFYIARFLSGISSTACYIVLPMYIAEVSENSTRGFMLASFAVFSNFGGLLVYITGPYMSVFGFNIFLLIFPVLFLIMFSIIAPESPYFFVRKRDFRSAMKSLNRLRGKDNQNDSEIEMQIITNAMENSRKGDIWKTLKKRHAIKGALIAFVLTAFQQLSGHSVFIPYTQTIFALAGNSASVSAISSMIVGSIAFVVSFFCPLIIDRKGRRFVLMISLSGIIFSEVIFGIFYYLSAQKYDISSFNWMPLVCLVLYMLFYTFGLGPLPLTITSEILPVNVKFLVSTIAGLLGTVSSMVFSKNYYNLNELLQYYGTIWLFAFLCTFLLIFTAIFVPETKGKSFSEILDLLEK